MGERFESDEELIKQIESTITSGVHFDAELDTDERVLARVTDGIYRQPSSALRELINNAFDADASHVSISTDAPRFGSITVSDDGTGMTPEVLANMIRHIGGSAKRTQRGRAIGVTDKDDPNLSKGGRRLIGKIGIGLFSVAQLSRQFIITTKTAKSGFQLFAHVTLERFDEASFAKIDAKGKHIFHAGKARIWAERTSDKKAHGTSIHLTALIPRIVDILQTRDIWAAIEEETLEFGKSKRVPPLYHIGQLKPGESASLLQVPKYPWDKAANETARFHALVDGVGNAWNESHHYSRLEHVLDNYFQTVWTLGLSLPLPYVDKHPFELTARDAKRFYVLPESRAKTQLEPLALAPGVEIKDAAKLPDSRDSVPNFAVTMDGIAISRPIRFSKYPDTSQALKGPVLFYGTASTDLSRIPESQRGGPLSFSAYFFWTERLIPQEHNGLLIRINGASGTLFDPTFLKYQVGERRLKQIMGEVFVHEGLDGALNIDRESFNTAHPHYQVLVNWVHNSLRLIRNVLKGLQADALRLRRAGEQKSHQDEIADRAELLIGKIPDTDPSEVPAVVIVDEAKEASKAIKRGDIAFLKSEVVRALGLSVSGRAWAEARIPAITRLLWAYGLLDDLEASEQLQIVTSILRLLSDTE